MRCALSLSVGASVFALSAAAASAAVTPAVPVEKQSEFARLVVSPVVMALVVIVIVSLLLFALSMAFGQRKAPLLTRVGSFVSVVGAEAPGGLARGQATETRQRRFGRGLLLARVRPSADRQGWELRLGTTLELADIDASPIQVVLLTAGATLVTAFILDLVLGPLGVIAALVGVPALTRWLILRKLSRKRRAFAEQLPDNLDVLASALRAGHSLVSALAVVADDAGEPSRGEYKRVLAEEQFGVQLEDALKVTATRMDNRDIEQVALVARLQREMGSNSAEVLDRVIETVRGRMELRRLVRTLTAQGRLSRWILTGLPLGLAVILTLLDAHYMHPLLHTFLGRALVVVAVCMVAFGSFIIGKIIDIKA